MSSAIFIICALPRAPAPPPRSHRRSPGSRCSGSSCRRCGRGSASRLGTPPRAQQLLRGQQHAGRAEAALQGVALLERGLQVGDLAGIGHAFDRFHARAVALHRQHQAAAHDHAVDAAPCRRRRRRARSRYGCRSAPASRAGNRPGSGAPRPARARPRRSRSPRCRGSARSWPGSGQPMKFDFMADPSRRYDMAKPDEMEGGYGGRISGQGRGHHRRQPRHRPRHCGGVRARRRADRDRVVVGRQSCGGRESDRAGRAEPLTVAGDLRKLADCEQLLARGEGAVRALRYPGQQCRPHPRRQFPGTARRRLLRRLRAQVSRRHPAHAAVLADAEGGAGPHRQHRRWRRALAGAGVH